MKRQRSLRTAKRRPTLFDAVAGRVSENGFIPRHKVPSKKHGDLLSTPLPLRPDEILYKRQNASERFAETDQYFAHSSLPAQLPLPDSDLLASIHAYVSQYCATMSRTDRDRAWRSMDETALLAMGVLIEEAVREAIGESGDLAFVEGEINDGPIASTNGLKDTPDRDRSDNDI